MRSFLRRITLLALSLAFANARPGACAAITVSVAPYQAITPGLVGLNNQMAYYNEPWTTYPGYPEALRRITPGVLRYPGGTMAQFWDFVNDCPLPPETTNNPNGWVNSTLIPAVFQPITNNDYTLTNSVKDLHGAWQQGNFTPIYCLNLVTPGADYYAVKWGRPVNAHPGTSDMTDDWWLMLEDRLSRCMNMLNRAAAIGLPMKYVELGNEFSLGSPVYYTQAFPDPGTSYAVAANYFAAQIKAAFPGVKILGVATAFDPSFAGGSRNVNWNTVVVPGFNRGLIDFVTMHVYEESGVSDISTYANWASAASTYDQAITYTLSVNNLSTLAASGWKVFYTEFAPNNTNPPLQGTWGNELMFVYAYIKLLSSGDAAEVSGHMFADCVDGQFLINGEGVALSLINNAAAGMSGDGLLGFSSNPPLGSTTFPSLAGMAFTDGTRIHAVIVNFSNAAQTVDVSGLMPVGAVTVRSASLPAVSSTSVPPIVQASSAPGQVALPAFSVAEVSNDVTNLLANVSTRGFDGTGAEQMIVGFTIAGSGQKQVLVRAVGPRLADFGVTGVLQQPSLSLVNSSQSAIATNTGWTTAPNQSAIIAATAAVGAFSLDGLPSGTDDTRSSVILQSLPTGSFTGLAQGAAATTGVVLVEAYDADNFATETASFSNLSTRGYVGTGADILIGGFVVTGNAPKTYLIRGDGPALSSFSISGLLANPTISVYATDPTGASYVLAANQAWGQAFNASQVPAAEQAAGAFNLAAGSADSALLVTLNPGSYTVEVSGVGSTTGIALLELYQLP